MSALNKYIISKTDLLTYRPTATLDDARILPFILEAQRLDLRPVLNDALYYAFVNDYDTGTSVMATQIYIDLLNGKTYSYNNQTIQFDGVKPMLCYFTLARFVADNPVNITRMGINVKRNEFSDPADPRLIQMTVNELRSAAVMYQNQVIQYLETLSSSYPLYDTGGGSSNASRKTSFNFFKL
jgi:hypothetical protein